MAVVPHQAAVLPLGIDDVRIRGVDHRVEAVAEDGDEPVAVANAVHVVGARRSSLGGVVLGAAVDVVEGRVVVDGDLVELGDRQVRGVAVGLAAIPGLVQSAIAADDQVVRILGIDPEGVIVDVLPALAQRPERLAAVLGDLEQRVHRVDAVEDVGVGDDLLVVLRAGGDVARIAWPSSRRRFRSGRSRSGPSRPRPWRKRRRD